MNNGDGQKKDEIRVLSNEVDGISISLGGDEWIKFRKDGWTFPDYMKFAQSRPIESMALLVDWAVDWHLLDANNALIPFDKAALQKNLGLVNVSYAKTTKMAQAVFVAFREAAEVPLA